MVIKVEGVTLQNAWRDEFVNRQTKERVEYAKAMLQVPGEAPLQLSVDVDDVPTLLALIGHEGTASIDISAEPNRRAKLSLKGFE